jgi:hypothetical protein
LAWVHFWYTFLRDRQTLSNPHDVHAALRKLERQACPPDRIEVARVRASELKNGHPRVRKPPPPQPVDLNTISLDFSVLEKELGVYD